MKTKSRHSGAKNRSVGKGDYHRGEEEFASPGSCAGESAESAELSLAGQVPRPQAPRSPGPPRPDAERTVIDHWTIGYALTYIHCRFKDDRMTSPCALCAGKGTSCCTGNQILLTSGDIERIASFLSRSDFYRFEMADEAYLDPGDDPLWTLLTIRPDHSRRVLRRSENRQCTLLGPHGCMLPMEQRPLVCRLYPVAYATDWIEGIEPSCPIAHTAHASELLDTIGMAENDINKWHRQLMDELFAEFRAAQPQGSGNASSG